jgi:hypothetical protein
MTEEEATELTIKLPAGIVLVVVVKHPGQEARVINSEIEAPREFIEDFTSVWDDIGTKVKVEIIRGLV